MRRMRIRRILATVAAAGAPSPDSVSRAPPPPLPPHRASSPPASARRAAAGPRPTSRAPSAPAAGTTERRPTEPRLVPSRTGRPAAMRCGALPCGRNRARPWSAPGAESFRPAGMPTGTTVWEKGGFRQSVFHGRADEPGTHVTRRGTIPRPAHHRRSRGRPSRLRGAPGAPAPCTRFTRVSGHGGDEGRSRCGRGRAGDGKPGHVLREGLIGAPDRGEPCLWGAGPSRSRRRAGRDAVKETAGRADAGGGAVHPPACSRPFPNAGRWCTDAGTRQRPCGVVGLTLRAGAGRPESRGRSAHRTGRRGTAEGGPRTRDRDRRQAGAVAGRPVMERRRRSVSFRAALIVREQSAKRT